MAILGMTTVRALQVHTLVSAVFTAPFFVKGAAEFGSMLVDGAVTPKSIASNPLLMHLFHVDAVKNIFITAMCYFASKFNIAERRRVCQLMMAMMLMLLPIFKIAPATTSGPPIPPPAIAYIGVTSVCYALALAGKVTIRAPCVPDGPPLAEGEELDACAAGWKSVAYRSTPAAR